MVTKFCALCRLDKSIDLFAKDRTKSDGLQRRCKDCQKMISAASYAANPERAKAKSLLPATRYASYRYDAKKRSIPFFLTREEFLTFWQTNCHYCGDQLATIGIDRIDNGIGYTIDNCVSCCWECNRIKSSREIELLNMHMLKMLKHQGIVQ